MFIFLTVIICSDNLVFQRRVGTLEVLVIKKRNYYYFLTTISFQNIEEKVSLFISLTVIICSDNLVFQRRVGIVEVLAQKQTS